MPGHTSKYCALCRDPPDPGEQLQDCYFCNAKFHLLCINLSKITPPEDQYKCELCIDDENNKNPLKEPSKKDIDEFEAISKRNEVWSKRLYHEKLLFINENVDDLQHFCSEKTMKNLLDKAQTNSSAKEVKEISK